MTTKPVKHPAGRQNLTDQKGRLPAGLQKVIAATHLLQKNDHFRASHLAQATARAINLPVISALIQQVVKNHLVLDTDIQPVTVAPFMATARKEVLAAILPAVKSLMALAVVA